VTSYHDHSERGKAPRLVRELMAGKSIALISDAGTPGIADPGFYLVRAAIEQGIRVVPIPGPCAMAAALSSGGLPADRFAFEGFVPARAGQRRKRFGELRAEMRTLIFYETARRLMACLEDVQAEMGDRQVVVARELTKLFEELLRGPVSSVLGELRKRDRAPQGEVVLLIAGGEGEGAGGAENVHAALARLRGEGLSLKEAARALARERGLSRREVYQLGLEGGAPGQRVDEEEVEEG
jgi:16S rRNA (cytidine1402-2'-O)-methyltransferase